MATLLSSDLPAGRAPSASLVREGVQTGLLGAGAVALWFLLVDGIAGRPLHTPALLGAIVAGDASPVLAAEGAQRLALAALYPLHLAAFVALGVAVVALVRQAERTPPLAGLLLLLFVAFEVGFTGIVAMLEQSGLGGLAWTQVAAGNLVAALAMGWYVLRRHPIADAWARRYDD